MPAADEQIQQDAERVHVRRCRDDSAGQLFRRRILRRHHRAAFARQRARRPTGEPAGIALDQLGDAEVEELGLPVGADQHVRRLDVTVHDQVGVGVRDRVHHVEAQAQARLDPERARVAVLVDALAVHVLEDEIRLSRRGDPGVDEMRDVRMPQAGEDGALAAETFFAGAPDERDVQQLDGRGALKPAVAAFGQPHAAGSALAKV